MSITVVDHYYDYERGWENTNPGWHEVIINYIDREKHRLIIEWMYEKIDNPERHARWVRLEDSSRFRFRYERDYILFTLRWS